MRFNQKELATVALLPSNKFEKEGILLMTEKQEGFFRRTEAAFDDTDDIAYFRLPDRPKRNKSLSCIGGITKVSSRWCRLRGNLLFYLKENDQFSAPLGLVVLEHCRAVIRNEGREIDGYAFFIEFKDGLYQRFAAKTEIERIEWVTAIKMASFTNLNKKIKFLREQILKFTQNNERTNQIDKDITSSTSSSAAATQQPNVNKKEIDISEVPICESAIFCDNLLCDSQGRAPSPFVKIQFKENCSNLKWIDYGQTEIVEQCSNPQFLCTVSFRESQGLSASSIIRFTCYDVQEKMSRTSIPIGFVEISLGVIKETTRLRIPLRSVRDNPGFITIVSWTSEDKKPMIVSPAKVVDSKNLGHRRSQSLPPKLGCKLFVPSHNKLNSVFINPMLHTYRLNSGLGGDISVFELMMESRICYLIPQQLLSIWILREKELLQEISGMGELGGEWRNKQMDLLDKHLKLLKDYSQAKQNLQQLSDTFFKKSVNKAEESVEFVPVNLHIQRMCVHNDTLKRSGTFDVVTVGAFARHSGKNKTGGLIKLLQQVKDSSIKGDQYNCKVEAANDAVQAIKHLRKEIVEIMSQLLTLAKSRNPKGMLPLCNEMVNKTKALLNIWEPSLVEEALTFIEQNRIIEEPDNSHVPISPFKKITQQLGALDLKSPELEDFATPIDPWPKNNSGNNSIGGNTTTSKTSTSHTKNFHTKSPSATDISAISAIQDTVKIYNSQKLSTSFCNSSCTSPKKLNHEETGNSEQESNNEIKFNETHFDCDFELLAKQNVENSLNNSEKTENIRNSHIISENTWHHGRTTENHQNDSLVSSTTATTNSLESYDTEYNPMNCTILLGQNGCFLDTKEMSSSPSANYYRPTEEPEPLDLTQLNIEASVMCLLSKVKFLCGRCGSPAVRLRQRKTSLKRVFNNSAPDVITNQPNISNNSSQYINNSNSSNAGSSTGATTTTVTTNGGLGGVTKADEQVEKEVITTMTTSSCTTGTATASTNEKDLNLALTEVARRVKTGNKFTDGLDISTDWAAELRPSMRKLRQAMDGLLKTSRLMHSVQRLQQDMRRINTNLAIMYRRDVCFSQALTTLISGLMAKLWGTVITERYIQILSGLGPLAYFEGLLSLYGNETDMWGDMCVAVEDLSAVNFTLIRSNIQREYNGIPVPRVTGSRQSLNVLLPIPENVYETIPPNKEISFKVTPVFFNIGINEKATLSETLGYTRDQHRSNWDNFDRLKQYHIRFKKLNLCDTSNNKFDILTSSSLSSSLLSSSTTTVNATNEMITDLLQVMEENLRNNLSKNVKILHLAEDICRAMHGIRFTSCKSAKDRTGMAVTLEQCRILQQEFHLPASHMQKVLNTMRTEGTRADNVVKNIGKKKYAFSLPQVLSLPALYRPQAGSYGKVAT